MEFTGIQKHFTINLIKNCQMEADELKIVQEVLVNKILDYVVQTVGVQDSVQLIQNKYSNNQDICQGSFSSSLNVDKYVQNSNEQQDLISYIIQYQSLIKEQSDIALISLKLFEDMLRSLDPELNTPNQLQKFSDSLSQLKLVERKIMKLNCKFEYVYKLIKNKEIKQDVMKMSEFKSYIISISQKLTYVFHQLTIFSIDHEYLKIFQDLGFSQKYYKQRSLTSLSVQELLEELGELLNLVCTTTESIVIQLFDRQNYSNLDMVQSLLFDIRSQNSLIFPRISEEQNVICEASDKQENKHYSVERSVVTINSDAQISELDKNYQIGTFRCINQDAQDQCIIVSQDFKIYIGNNYNQLEIYDKDFIPIMNLNLEDNATCGFAHDNYILFGLENSKLIVVDNQNHRIMKTVHSIESVSKILFMEENILIFLGAFGSIQLFDISNLCIFSFYRHSIHSNINCAHYQDGELILALQDCGLRTVSIFRRQKNIQFEENSYKTYLDESNIKTFAVIAKELILINLENNDYIQVLDKQVGKIIKSFVNPSGNNMILSIQLIHQYDVRKRHFAFIKDSHGVSILNTQTLEIHRLSDINLNIDERFSSMCQYEGQNRLIIFNLGYKDNERVIQALIFSLGLTQQSQIM
ncbi:UNKNOWN [Stylonychia lemnae]|uniref:Uncharacterized protein n=1 Tax=Stylonychia lemnae TaxID=5949 RepID=A0A078ATY0_STYLE|nr:UNKNOWN [Stylonychia lemnae]|eukprot:CDW85416.1 UNKNOWN [Stylonychia lemnae]